MSPQAKALLATKPYLFAGASNFSACGAAGETCTGKCDRSTGNGCTGCECLAEDMRYISPEEDYMGALPSLVGDFLNEVVI